jgi:thymidylate kinase
LSWQLAAAQSAHVIIADRFVLDFIVDQIAAGMLDVNDAPALAADLPPADVAIHLDVDNEELLRRLKPGDDGDRVLTQAMRYRQVARTLGVSAVDGREPSAVCRAIESILASGQ